MNFDRLFINGNFIDRKDISCIGVSEGRITYLGKKDGLPSESLKDAVDLKGKSICHGFSDTHLHMLSYWEKQYGEVDLSHVRPSQELVDTVQAFIRDQGIEDGAWVIGSGWHDARFDQPEIPDRHTLDKISTNHPIYLKRACYHMASVNSLGLSMAGIDESTPEVPGGSIDKDEQGLPNGILRENAEQVIMNILPDLEDKAQLKKMILEACDDLLKAGITSVHTDDFGHVENKAILLETFKELAADDQLPIKLILQLRASEKTHIDTYKALGLQSWQKFGSLTIGPIKIISDGSLGAETAALSKPYEGSDNNFGILVMPIQELTSLVDYAFESGFDMAVHAIGDLAISNILDIYEANQTIIQSQGYRPSIIHCQIGSNEILNRFKDLDVIANIQPIFLNSDWCIAEEKIGSKRLQYSYCWKTYVDVGILCIGSSDTPIEPFAPLLGIYSAVTRKDLSGLPKEGWIPEEALNVNDALKLYTENPAQAIGKSSEGGCLKVGNYADFLILSDNIMAVDPNTLKSIEVQGVCLGDKLHHFNLTSSKS